MLKKNKELNKFPQEENISAIISGRIIFFRDLGKLIFIKLRDISGTVQISLNKNTLSDFEYWKKELKLWDIITVSGVTYLTTAGEITLQVQQCQLDIKCLNDVPEKWSGIKDDDLRLRQRYVDIIQNEDTRRVFATRAQIIKNIREFLYNRDFMEVETPILQTVASGAAATPFKTHHNALDIPLYLRIAPELFLKRMIIAGYNKIFEIGKCFRNEGIDPTHLQEFTMLETYETYQTYEGLQEYAIDLLTAASKNINIPYDFTKTIKMSYYDFLGEYGQIDYKKIHDYNYLVDIAQKHQLNYSNHKTHQGLIDFIYKKLCVSKITDPLLIFDYPKNPLAKDHDTDPNLSKKFQVILEKQEIINAYVEQNDPDIQKKAFELQEQYKNMGEEETFAMDHDFIHALSYGMAPTCGFGLGIDRLTTKFAQCSSIRDSIFFPITRIIK